jgi:hypothetical protein
MLMMLLCLPLLAVPSLVFAGLFLWAFRLRRRAVAPSFATATALALLWTALGTTLAAPVVAVATRARANHAFADDASQKARVLAESISEAMNYAAVAFFVGVTVSTVWLLLVSWRWQWSARALAAGNRPYR